MRIRFKGDKPYLSVTSILELMFPMTDSARRSYENWCHIESIRKGKKITPQYILLESTRLGTLIHEMLENRYEGVSDIFDKYVCGASERGYKRSVEKFCEDFELLESEQTVFNDEYGYCGMYDGVCKRGGEVYMFDAKSYGAWRGKYKRSSDKIKKLTLQLNMYNYAQMDKFKMLGVIFLNDGTYLLEEIKKNEDWKGWITANQETINNVVNNLLAQQDEEV